MSPATIWEHTRVHSSVFLTVSFSAPLFHKLPKKFILQLLLSNNRCCSQSHEHTSTQPYAAGDVCRRRAKHNFKRYSQTSETNWGIRLHDCPPNSSQTPCCHAGNRRTAGTNLQLIAFCACVHTLTQTEKKREALESHLRKCFVRSKQGALRHFNTACTALMTLGERGSQCKCC